MILRDLLKKCCCALPWLQPDAVWSTSAPSTVCSTVFLAGLSEQTLLFIVRWEAHNPSTKTLSSGTLSQHSTAICKHPNQARNARRMLLLMPQATKCSD
jgi:hypothetical protein